MNSLKAYSGGGKHRARGVRESTAEFTPERRGGPGLSEGHHARRLRHEPERQADQRPGRFAPPGRPRLGPTTVYAFMQAAGLVDD
ncbi:MAG: hypothetical protein ACXW0F_11635, partial [Gaiellaceae bacterium]